MSENPLTVRIEISTLGETMNAIRTWLDGQKIEPTTFKALPVGFELAFRSELDAGRFRKQFGGLATAASVVSP